MRIDLARPEAGWIEGSHGPIFATYHAPSSDYEGECRAHAVLICDSLGPDRMNLHLTHRSLGMRLAERGFAVLRFDPTGTADASGSPRDPNWPSSWWSDAGTSAEYLLARSGATRLAAYGARLGATLAATLPGVDTLLLWGPYQDGKLFLRNERMLTRLTGSNVSPRRPRFASPGDEGYLGFAYPARAIELLHNLHQTHPPSESCTRARIISWDESDEVGSIASALERSGARVDFDRPSGFRSDDSIERQRVPHALIENLTSWLVHVDGEKERPRSPRPVTAKPLPPRTQVDRGLPNSGRLEEEAVRFGRDDDLFGILSIPFEPQAGPTLILVNGGNNHRPGINRNYTEWARDAALRGSPALRMDIRGLGDSPPLRARDLNVLYRKETRQDVIEAIDHLSDRMPDRGVVLCGLCAGAFQALHAARIDPRVEGVILIDLLRWDHETPKSGRRTFWDRRRHDLGRWRHRLTSRGPGRSSLARGLLDLTAKGIEVLLISCVDARQRALVIDTLQPDLPSLEATGHFRLERLSEADHILTPLWSQVRVADELASFFDRIRSRHES